MATLFPFPANWSAGVQVTLRFRTDVFVSRSGKEQRRALHTDPRKSISYSALAHAGNYRTFMRLMADSQNDDIILPDPTRSIGVTAAISSGATSFTVAGTRPYWITSGSTVILDDGENRATATVSGVSSSTITIGATTRAWPSHTLVRPALTGLLAPSIPSKMSTDNLANINVEFTVAPGSETYTTTSPVTTLEGVEVFTYDWNWATDVTIDYSWPVQVVDFGWGTTNNNRIINFGTNTQKVGIVLTYTQAEGMKDFFCRAKGQRGVFWMPSGADDLTATANISNGATSITVAGVEELDSVHRGLAVYRKTGTPLYFKINSMSSSGGNTTINLLNSASAAVPLSNIKRISWMNLARFASDEMTFDFLTDDTVQVQPAIMSLPI